MMKRKKWKQIKILLLALALSCVPMLSAKADKNALPSIEKFSADKKSVEIGETITYTIVVNSGSDEKGSASKSDLKVNLTLPEGLTLKPAIEWKTASGSFQKKSKEWELSNGVYSAEFTPTIGNVDVTLTFQAVLNEKAELYTAEQTAFNESKVELTYTNNGSPAAATPKSYSVYTYAVTLNVVNGAKEALAGTEFTLKNSAGEYYAEPTDETDQNEKRFQTNVTECVTDVNGQIRFEGLAAGTYTLRQTSVLAGYQAVDEEVTIELAEMNSENPPASTTDSVTVVNKKSSGVPSTGGKGRTLIYQMGTLLALCAGVLLITRKRFSKLGV